MRSLPGDRSGVKKEKVPKSRSELDGQSVIVKFRIKQKGYALKSGVCKYSKGVLIIPFDPTCRLYLDKQFDGEIYEKDGEIIVEI